MSEFEKALFFIKIIKALHSHKILAIKLVREHYDVGLIQAKSFVDAILKS